MVLSEPSGTSWTVLIHSLIAEFCLKTVTDPFHEVFLMTIVWLITDELIVRASASNPGTWAVPLLDFRLRYLSGVVWTISVGGVALSKT